VGLKLNGTYQLLVYIDVVNPLDDTIRKNTETLIDASKEVGLEEKHRKLSICCCLFTGMQGKIMT
jgi:hypothetical protein